MDEKLGREDDTTSCTVAVVMVMVKMTQQAAQWQW
jgi:hypothetical protein